MAQRQQERKISGVGDAIERTKIIQQDSLEEQSSLSCGIMECLLHNEKRSPEIWHGSQHVNSEELVPQLATLCLFITCKFSNHKSVSRPMLYMDGPERPINKKWCLVSWDGLVIDVPWGVILYSRNNCCRRHLMFSLSCDGQLWLLEIGEPCWFEVEETSTHFTQGVWVSCRTQ